MQRGFEQAIIETVCEMMERFSPFYREKQKIEEEKLLREIQLNETRRIEEMLQERRIEEMLQEQTRRANSLQNKERELTQELEQLIPDYEKILQRIDRRNSLITLTNQQRIIATTGFFDGRYISKHYQEVLQNSPEYTSQMIEQDRKLFEHIGQIKQGTLTAELFSKGISKETWLERIISQLNTKYSNETP